MEQKVDYISKLRGETNSVTIFQPGQKSCDRACISPSGDLLFVVSQNTIYGYNLFTETCFKIYADHEGAIEDLDIKSERAGELLVSVGNSMHIIVHDVSTGNVLIDDDQKMSHECCCFGPKAMNNIATVTSGKFKQDIILKIFHIVNNNKELMEKHSFKFDTPVNAIRWPNADTIIAGDNKGRIHVLDVRGDLIETCVIDAHRGAINNITMSFDGNLFATASSDTTACLWRVPQNEKEEPKKIGTYNHTFIVSCAAISPDMHHIVLSSYSEAASVARTNSGSTDFTINFFHTIFQKEFASMKVHKSTVNWVGFTPDGNSIVTTSFEGTVQVIRLGGQYRKLVKEHEEELEQIRANFK